MSSKSKKSWEEFLNPDITRPRLISASVYIAVYEAFKDLVVDRIRSFYSNGFDENGDIIDPKYKSDVLSRNKSKLYASIDWLKDNGAINDDDIEKFEHIKICRNTLAHELFSLVADRGLPESFEQNFKDLLLLLRKIELWWIVNVEIPTNPDYIDQAEINEDEITPGMVMGIQLLMDIALGSEEESRFYYEEFKKKFNGG